MDDQILVLWMAHIHLCTAQSHAVQDSAMQKEMCYWVFVAGDFGDHYVTKAGTLKTDGNWSKSTCSQS